jgi:hypothetical protein
MDCLENRTYNTKSTFLVTWFISTSACYRTHQYEVSLGEFLFDSVDIFCEFFREIIVAFEKQLKCLLIEILLADYSTRDFSMTFFCWLRIFLVGKIAVARRSRSRSADRSEAAGLCRALAIRFYRNSAYMISYPSEYNRIELIKQHK